MTGLLTSIDCKAEIHTVYNQINFEQSDVANTKIKSIFLHFVFLPS